MRQLPLGVRIADRALFATYLAGANGHALEHLQGLARGSLSGTAWLCGPESVGKTHLLQATCVLASERMPAGYFPLAEWAALCSAALEGLPQLGCICLDDLDSVVGNAAWERSLFGLYREVEERGARLIAAALQPPGLYAWSLPDLASRFAASAVFQLQALGEAEQREALQLRARTRGFELPESTARWLRRRFPRDMASLYALLDTLDEAALIEQRRLTVPFIRSVLVRR